MEALPQVPDSDVNDYMGGTEDSVKISVDLPESLHVNPRPKVTLRARDWNLRELKVLIAAKRHEHEQLVLDQGNAQVKLSARKNKWEKIAHHIVKEGYAIQSEMVKLARKKWATVYKDFKRVYDHEKYVGVGDRSYWNMTTSERRKRSRPLNFPEELFRDIKDWLQSTEEWSGKRLELSSQVGVNPSSSNVITLVDRTTLSTHTPDAGLDESISTMPASSPRHKNCFRNDQTKNKRKRTCYSAAKAMAEAVIKLVEVLKDDVLRKTENSEKTMEWEKQRKAEHLAMLRDQMESRAKVEMVQAQSFNILAQVLSKLLEKNNNSSSSVTVSPDLNI